MARIEIRFKNGDLAEWPLHDAMSLSELVRILTRSTGVERVVSFGVVSDEGGSADYNFVGLAMAEVVSWELKGMFDATVGAALWSELQPPEA